MERNKKVLIRRLLAEVMLCLFCFLITCTAMYLLFDKVGKFVYWFAFIYVAFYVALVIDEVYEYNTRKRSRY